MLLSCTTFTWLPEASTKLSLQYARWHSRAQFPAAHSSACSNQKASQLPAKLQASQCEPFCQPDAHNVKAAAAQDVPGLLCAGLAEAVLDNR
eukprot:15178-Heterococcus_DN1.PRE.7